MHITIDTNNLTELDLRVLAAITGAPAQAAPKTAPATKTAAAPKAAKAAKVEAEEPAEEPAEDDSDDTGAATMEDAVALATSLVSAGKAAQVKAALGDCGAKRVSELSEDKIGDFIAALS